MSNKGSSRACIRVISRAITASAERLLEVEGVAEKVAGKKEELISEQEVAKHVAKHLAERVEERVAERVEVRVEEEVAERVAEQAAE